MKKQELLFQSLGGTLQNILRGVPQQILEQTEEIRVRIGKPLVLLENQKEYFVMETGEVTKVQQKAYIPQQEDIQGTLEVLSQYSLYAFAEELRNGFLTVAGGHRIGIVGRAVVSKGYLETIKNISALNIRISHEIKGCADKALEYAVKEGRFHHTLILSPPGCGKTTLLRDMVRQLSDGKPSVISGQTVGIVDERGEIAGCYQGIPQNDVGIRTDVLDCCPKAEGMLLLVRSMSPDIIAVDEIGKEEDFLAIASIVNAGIQLICTVHGNDLEDVKRRPILGELLEEGIFSTILVLSGKEKTGEIVAVYDGKLQRLG